MDHEQLFYIALKDGTFLTAAPTLLEVEEKLLASKDDGRGVVIRNSESFEISDEVRSEALELVDMIVGKAAR